METIVGIVGVILVALLAAGAGFGCKIPSALKRIRRQTARKHLRDHKNQKVLLLDLTRLHGFLVREHLACGTQF